MCAHRCFAEFGFPSTGQEAMRRDLPLSAPSPLLNLMQHTVGGPSLLSVETKQQPQFVKKEMLQGNCKHHILLLWLVPLKKNPADFCVLCVGDTNQSDTFIPLYDGRGSQVPQNSPQGLPPGGFCNPVGCYTGGWRPEPGLVFPSNLIGTLLSVCHVDLRKIN